MMGAAVLNGVIAASIGFTGASLFWLIGVPLPWMLGSMSACAIVAILGKPWRLPRQARDAARPVVGVLAGSAFTPAILNQAGQWAAIIAVVICFGMAATLAGYLFFRFVAKCDPVTAFFASTPAGLTEMSLLGDSLGGNIRSLFLVHSIRIVGVVFLVPLLLRIFADGNSDANLGVAARPSEVTGEVADWLILLACGAAGYILGKGSKLPSGVMIASLLLSATLHLVSVTAAAPPHWLVVIVQVTIGCVAGSRFANVVWAEALRTAICGAIWSILIVAAAALTAEAGAWVFGMSFGGLMLALAPGGMVEMTMLTYALGIDVALVVTCQVLRNVSTLVIAPMLYRLIAR